MKEADLVPLEKMNIKVSVGPFLFDILLDNAFTTELRLANPTATHTHPAYELQFITRGSGKCILERTAIPVRADDALLIVPGVYHRFDGCAEFSRVYMQFTCSMQKSIDDLFPLTESKDISQALSSMQDVVLIGQAHGLFRLIRMIYRELRKNSFGSYVQVQGLFMQLIVEMLRAASNTSQPQDQPRFPLKTTDDSRTRIIDLFFEKMIYQPLKIEQLAAELHLSVKQTYRVIQQLYGKSFKQIVKESQIEWAKELLTSSSLTVQQIADQIGYADPRHFSRQFAIATGSTPSGYRLQYRRANSREPVQGTHR